MANPEQPEADDSTLPKGSSVNQAEIDYEKRYKDTQAAYTKSQQELKAVRAKAETLEKLVTPKVEIDDETAKELEGLKFSNPDEWRSRMNKLEIEANSKYNATLNEATQEATRQAELENRAQILADFQARNPNLVINDEVIKYDVPPRITNKLEKGEITFEQYLADVASYLGTPKVVGDDNKTMNQPNINNVGGSHTPSDDSSKKSIVEDYANIVY